MAKKPLKMFKVNSLSEVKDIDSLYCIKTPTDTEFSIVVTDAFGAIVNLKDLQSPIQGITSDDGTIEITGTEFKNLRLSAILVNAINNSLKAGDNISDLINDAGYLTSFTETDPIFQASEASLFVSGDKANLDNQSNVNTGDETTLSIQTKRPLKTVDSKSLEGTGNIEIDYNTVTNKPAEFPPSTHTHSISEVIELQSKLNEKQDITINNLKPSDIDLVALGDSVTFGAGSTTGSTSYIDIINAKLGFKSFTKLAVSGTRTMPGGGMPELYTQVQAIPAGSDLITVMIGINDRSVSPLGNLNTVLNKSFASLDRTLSFAEAFRFNLETIKRNFPLAKIFVLTPTKTTWSSSPSLDAYAQIEIGIANFLGIPIIDTNTSSGIYYNSPYLADATHPNDTGYSIIADFVEAGLKSATQQRYVDTGIGTVNNIAKWGADGRLVDSGIIENATGVRLLNVINATSGLGIGMLLNSTINASANNDVLSTFRAVGTFNAGAFSGVNGYAIRSSGALRVDRFSDSSQQLVIDNVNAGTTLTSYSNPAGAKEMILNSTTNMSNTPVGSGLNGILFQVRGDTKAQLFNDGRWRFQNGGTFANNGDDLVQITGSAIATAWKVTGGTTAQYQTGTGSLVDFGTSVRSSLLTGYASGVGTISASDNVLQAIQKLNGNDALKAPLNSPYLIGIPTAPTAAVGTNTAQVATTAFVKTEIENSDFLLYSYSF